MASDYEARDTMYERIQEMQNRGVRCPYCLSPSGHYGHCDIVQSVNNTPNNMPNMPALESAKAYQYIPESGIPEITKADRLRLSGMGVIW
jgi:hypothetical protein